LIHVIEKTKPKAFLSVFVPLRRSLYLTLGNFEKPDLQWGCGCLSLRRMASTDFLASTHFCRVVIERGVTLGQHTTHFFAELSFF
jgi:hypothetical protein